MVTLLLVTFGAYFFVDCLHALGILKSKDNDCTLRITFIGTSLFLLRTVQWLTSH